jgi:hypothetical protein
VFAHDNALLAVADGGGQPQVHQRIVEHVKSSRFTALAGVETHAGLEDEGLVDHPLLEHGGECLELMQVSRLSPDAQRPGLLAQ